MALEITTTKISSVNSVAQTDSTAITDSSLTAKLSAADDRCFFIIDNSEGTSNAIVALNYGNGITKTVGKVLTGKMGVMFADSLGVKANGKYSITVNPANAGIKISAVEFLPAVNN